MCVFGRVCVFGGGRSVREVDERDTPHGANHTNHPVPVKQAFSALLTVTVNSVDCGAIFIRLKTIPISGDFCFVLYICFIRPWQFVQHGNIKKCFSSEM